MGCRASVEAELQAVGGVRLVQVDLRAQTAAVVFDPTRADAAALRAALTRAGYTPKRETLNDS